MTTHYYELTDGLLPLRFKTYEPTNDRWLRFVWRDGRQDDFALVRPHSNGALPEVWLRRDELELPAIADFTAAQAGAFMLPRVTHTFRLVAAWGSLLMESARTYHYTED